MNEVNCEFDEYFMAFRDVALLAYVLSKVYLFLRKDHFWVAKTEIL